MRGEPCEGFGPRQQVGLPELHRSGFVPGPIEKNKFTARKAAQFLPRSPAKLGQFAPRCPRFVDVLTLGQVEEAFYLLTFVDGDVTIGFPCQLWWGIDSPIPLFGVQSLPGFPIVW